ncbi:hypothetical protein E4T44_02395 [Aureobasidium sp. EXF-8845]|nr:hypothetical protein E4T44_02395 [Aureobasidium sp. EXF-8845]KAI4855669.1 hypothetical protein E4T45_02884 [Aureobasidium sp. EXF-8846]
MSGTTQSHATGDSKVPSSIQQNAPKEVENALPNAAHDTGSQSQSHATGPSKVPEAIQNIAPKGLEEALPESIHPTNK